MLTKDRIYRGRPWSIGGNSLDTDTYLLKVQEEEEEEEE
jgi:hypothetical protein